MRINNRYRYCINRLKNSTLRFLDFGKVNYLSCLGLFFCVLLAVFGASMLVVPFDGQASNEIVAQLTRNATASSYGYAINAVSMVETGNSDFYIYTDNDLQNFQMRNHHFDGVKSFIFSGYTPDQRYVPVRIDGDQKMDCSVLLYQSKYNGTDFYFDLPLLAGSFTRYTEKKNVVIPDVLADRLKDKEQAYSSLIGKKLSGETTTRSGTSYEDYSISAVVSTGCPLGELLLASFGKNLLFLPEYNLFQMRGSLYFVASSNKVENKEMVDFVLRKYRSYYGASRDLQIGYSAKYSFYDYASSQESMILGDTDARLNAILDFYNSTRPIIFSVVGAIMMISSFAFSVVVSLRFRRSYRFGIGLCLSWLWVCSGLALLINSILYAYVPLPALASGVRFFGFSTVGSAVMLLVWLAIVGMLTFFAMKRYQLFCREMGRSAGRKP